MTVEKIRDLSDQELEEQMRQAGEQLFRVRFQKSMGNLEGLKQMKVHKLDIARAKTVRREREIAGASSSTPVLGRQSAKDSGPKAQKKAEQV